MSICKRIKNLREDFDPAMTQKELGEKLHKTQRAISRLETGDSHMQDTDIIAYCNFFGVSADYILGLTDDPTPHK